MQPTIDELNLAMEVYKQQQRKMDVYQEDITLLNQKSKCKVKFWKKTGNLLKIYQLHLLKQLMRKVFI